MIVLYHNVFPDSVSPKYWWAGEAINLTVFKRHILWLERHYRIVSLVDYLVNDQKKGFLSRKPPVAITFDDGLRITYQCVSSFLAERKIPATFFVSTSHLEHGEILWFSYLDALCSEKLYNAIQFNSIKYSLQTLPQCRQTKIALTFLAKVSRNPVEFCKYLAKMYPIPAEIIAKYEGMTHEQLIDVGKSNLLDVGAHTISHPFLDQLPENVQMEEVLGGKKILTELTGKPIRFFAYPGGEYNHETIEIVKNSGFEASFAIISKKLGTNAIYEINRVGIYSQSLLKFQMKTLGAADLARWVGLRVG